MGDSWQRGDPRRPRRVPSGDASVGDYAAFARRALAALSCPSGRARPRADWARLRTWIAHRHPGALDRLARIEADPKTGETDLVALLREIGAADDQDGRPSLRGALPGTDAVRPRRPTRIGPATVTGAVLLMLIMLTTAVGPVLYRVNPNDLDYGAILTPSSPHHVLGTDALGRDLAARLLAGGRNSLLIGLCTMLATGVVGTLLGLISGANRRLDPYVMRVLDVMMAFPALLLALTILASLGNSATNVVIALSLVYIPRTARIVRGEALVLRDVTYVEAARSVGASPLRIVFRHLLPGLLPPLVVQQTFLFAYAILGEAGLSFVGVGIQPPSASWGNILGEARAIFQQGPWLVVFPGFAVAVTVLSLNLLGDGLSDFFNPRQRTA